jgi:hypothetical protein
MRQQKYVLESRIPIAGANELPSYIRLYLGAIAQRNILELKKDGVIPFFIKFFSLNANGAYSENDFLKPAFEDIRTLFLVGKRRLSSEYLHDRFWIYKISDYGNQSLSPGLADFIPVCYNWTTGSNKGKKIPQNRIAYIKDFNTKQTYLLLNKEETVAPTLSIVINYKTMTDKKEAPTKKLVATKNQFNQFVFNAKTAKVDNIENLALYVLKDGSYYELQNSNYVMNIQKVSDFPQSNTFVSEQGSYFKSQLDGANFQKEIHDIEITMNADLKDVNEIYLFEKDEYVDHYYTTYGNLKLKQFEKTSDIDVYANDNSGFLIKLIPGHDYYVSNKSLVVKPANGTEASNSEIFEVLVNIRRENHISIPFTTSTTTFRINKAMHDRYLPDWKAKVTGSGEKSFVSIFENGKLIDFSDKSSDYSTSAKYEYILEDIIIDSTIELPASNSATFLVSTSSFDNYNEYKLLTDPYTTTYGETSVANTNKQEVYLYDKNLGFRLFSDASNMEPYIGITSSKLKINDVLDPYLDVNFLPAIETSYTEHQTTKLKDKIYLTANQTVEKNVAIAKSNLLKIVANSNLTFTNYTGVIPASSFFFLLIKKGISNSSVNVSYRLEGQTAIYKKEYNCRFDINNNYLSLPFFLETMIGGSNKKVTITIENSDGTPFAGQYYLYR